MEEPRDGVGAALPNGASTACSPPVPTPGSRGTHTYPCPLGGGSGACFSVPCCLPEVPPALSSSGPPGDSLDNNAFPGLPAPRQWHLGSPPNTHHSGPCRRLISLGDPDKRPLGLSPQGRHVHVLELQVAIWAPNPEALGGSRPLTVRLESPGPFDASLSRTCLWGLVCARLGAGPRASSSRCRPCVRSLLHGHIPVGWARAPRSSSTWALPQPPLGLV